MIADLYNSLAFWLEAHFTWLTVFGLFGQFMFSMRFITQWLASEKEKKSVIPESFWYFSIAGGAIVFVYGVQRDDLVIMLGQGFGLFIYLRNVYFVRTHKKLARAEKLAALSDAS